MTGKDYSCTFHVPQTPQEVYDAITRVTDWWTVNTEGNTEAVGDEFTVQFGDVHLTTQRITEAVPGERIVWHVTRSRLTFIADMEEWKGTDIIFDITATAEGTRLTMTHMGLNPSVQCYKDCRKGWDYFMESLRKLITEGVGQPDRSEPVRHFTTTIVVDRSPREVFNAISNVRGWWSEEIEGNTEQLHDEFAYHYKDMHRCLIKLIAVVPDEKVVWEVLDNHFTFTTDRTEWKGTTISFEIFKQDNRTQLRFTHWGLVPEQECFDICSNAWTDFVQNSLMNLITSGQGTPNKKEDQDLEHANDARTANS